MENNACFLNTSKPCWNTYRATNCVRLLFDAWDAHFSFYVQGLELNLG